MSSEHKSRTGLSRNKWERLKELRPSKGRYIHVSAEVRMNPNPLDPTGTLGLKLIPWIGPGRTYNVGRNKAKREKKGRRF